ncbi:MAG TPA: hypothetical protein VMW63_04115 [Methanoregulaceae archaeon]|nr:hypothetical protein [Methanoregulaceae archaeon]
MDARLMDILTAVGSFFVFIVLLIFLPGLIGPAIGYITAIIVFILVISGAGYMINKNIK